MKKALILILLSSTTLLVDAQSGSRDIRQGNRYFKKDKFSDAETAYREALGEKKLDRIASFNLGDALYRQKKYDEATRQFQAAATSDIEKTQAAKAYHNLGNSLLEAGKIDESIEAYKDALRRDPTDLSTKYNLVYAQMLKKKQQQQNQNQQNQDKQNQDKQNQDQQNQDKQNQDQKNQDKQNQDKQNQQNSDNKPSNAQPVKMSKEDARRLLEALANDEKKVEDKVKKEKAKASKVRTIKDW